MKTKAFCLLLAASLLTAVPALAQGVIYKDSSKDGIARSVPVPVPVPIPDFAARWYLRADLAAGFMNPDPSEHGIEYGNFYSPPDLETPFGSGTFARSGGDDTVFSFGGGVGYYWTPSLRTDITLEGRTKSQLKLRGSYSYDQEEFDGVDWNPTGNQIDGATTDTAKLSSGVLLFNAYYDFAPRNRFTPYIGGGVGLAVTQLDRRFNNSEAVCDPGDIVFPGDTCFDVGTPAGTASASDKSYTVTFAAAAMAGFSYAITPDTLLDINYRYLYIGSSDASLMVNGTRSTFSTGDIHEHQIRAGLRWNIQ